MDSTAIGSRVRVVFLAVVVAGLASPARGGELGLVLGVRSGMAVPMGNASSGASSTALADVFGPALPVQLDAGFRLGERLVVGGYAEYGFASVARSTCTAGFSCSGHHVRFGLEGLFAFLPRATFTPWVGVGGGATQSSYRLRSGGLQATFELEGLEANLQVGGDYRVARVLSVGPYLALSVARYSTFRVRDSDSPTVPEGAVLGFEPGTHAWLSFGLKATFNL